MSCELTWHSPTHHASNVMIEGLDVGIDAQQLQTLAVWLPQKFYPWGENGAVTAVLGILPTHSTATQHTELANLCTVPVATENAYS
jgi:hypothetical protein